MGVGRKQGGRFFPLFPLPLTMKVLGKGVRKTEINNNMDQMDEKEFNVAQSFKEYWET